MDIEVLNSAELTNYFQEIIEETLKCRTNSFSKADYDPDAPEIFFTQCWFSIGMSMVKRTKTLFENVRKKQCENCKAMDSKLEKLNSKLADITKTYNRLLSFVHTLNPIGTQNFFDSQEISKPGSPKAGTSGKYRTPLTPSKSSSDNIIRDIPCNSSSPKYFSPKNQQGNSELVGSPLYSSTQNSIGIGRLNLQFDENMKIKNSLTPKKKKKEAKLSPLKPPPNNLCLTPQASAEFNLGTSLHNESYDSIGMMPETPPDNNRIGQVQKKIKNEVKTIIPTLPNSDVEDVEGEEALTPVIPRRSENMIEDVKSSKTPERYDKEIGISPSIMFNRVPARNLMNSSSGLGTLDPDSSLKSVSSNSHLTASPQFLNSSDMLGETPPSKVENAMKSKSGWVSVTTDKKKVDNISSSSSLSFKAPFNKSRRMKQMTLLQMKKKSITKNINVDISTLDEFNGGARPRQSALKRKSDEKSQDGNMTDAFNKQCVRSKQGSADKTVFDEFALQAVPKQSSSKILKRGKKDLNRTADLLADLDRLPNRKSPEPGFAYKPERAIRKKEERAKLTGWDCEDCRKYYEAIGVDADPTFLQKLKNQCSKHRAKYPVNLNGTPKGYWDTDFPSTQELKRTKAFRTDSYVDSDEYD